MKLTNKRIIITVLTVLIILSSSSAFAFSCNHKYDVIDVEYSDTDKSHPYVKENISPWITIRTYRNSESGPVMVTMRVPNPFAKGTCHYTEDVKITDYKCRYCAKVHTAVNDLGEHGHDCN